MATSSSTSAMAIAEVAVVAVEALAGVTTIVAIMPEKIKFYLGIGKSTATNAETWINSVTGKLIKVYFQELLSLSFILPLF